MKSKLNNQDRNHIWVYNMKLKCPQRKLADSYNVSQSTISKGKCRKETEIRISFLEQENKLLRRQLEQNGLPAEPKRVMYLCLD